jgi:hypothetical protein
MDVSPPVMYQKCVHGASKLMRVPDRILQSEVKSRALEGGKGSPVPLHHGCKS